MLTLHRCLLPFLCLKCVCLPRLSLSRWTTENRERTVVDGGETADEFHAPACELFCMAKTGFLLSFWQCTDTYICKCVYVPIFLWNVRYKCRLLNRWWQHVCMKTWNHAHILHCCRRSKHSCIRFLRTWSLRSNLFLSHLLFWHMGTLWAPEPPSRPGLLYSARTSEARPVGLPVRIKRPPSSHRVIILILTHTALSQSGRESWYPGPQLSINYMAHRGSFSTGVNCIRPACCTSSGFGSGSFGARRRGGAAQIRGLRWAYAPVPEFWLLMWRWCMRLEEAEGGAANRNSGELYRD